MKTSRELAEEYDDHQIAHARELIAADSGDELTQILTTWGSTAIIGAPSPYPVAFGALSALTQAIIGMAEGYRADLTRAQHDMASMADLTRIDAENFGRLEDKLCAAQVTIEDYRGILADQDDARDLLADARNELAEARARIAELEVIIAEANSL